MDFIQNWLGSLNEGIDSLDESSCAKLFKACGRNCAESGVINYYRELYDENGGLDGMFRAFSGEVGGLVIESGKSYEISFSHCLCDLHSLGYINSAKLCECSKQSILHVMSTLEPKKRISVRRVHTVLEGADECRFRINIE